MSAPSGFVYVVIGGDLSDAQCARCDRTGPTRVVTMSFPGNVALEISACEACIKEMPPSHHLVTPPPQDVNEN